MSSSAAGTANSRGSTPVQDENWIGEEHNMDAEEEEEEDEGAEDQENRPENRSGVSPVPSLVSLTSSSDSEEEDEDEKEEEDENRLLSGNIVFPTSYMQEFCKNKHIVFIGDSVQRCMYKDFLLKLQHDRLLRRRENKEKCEEEFLNDRLVFRTEITNGREFQEVREYQSEDGFHLLKYYFVTRCYNEVIEEIIKQFQTEMPDVIFMNSCLWDLCRYPDGEGEYPKRFACLMERLRVVLPPSTTFVWLATLPLASQISCKGLLSEEISFLGETLRLSILEANYQVNQLLVQYSFDCLDLNYYMRPFVLTHREKDGVHWDAVGHRHMTDMMVTFLHDAWGTPLPGIVADKLLDTDCRLDLPHMTLEGGPEFGVRLSAILAASVGADLAPQDRDIVMAYSFGLLTSDNSVVSDDEDSGDETEEIGSPECYQLSASHQDFLTRQGLRWDHEQQAVIPDYARLNGMEMEGEEQGELGEESPTSSGTTLSNDRSPWYPSPTDLPPPPKSHPCDPLPPPPLTPECDRSAFLNSSTIANLSGMSSNRARKSIVTPQRAKKTLCSPTKNQLTPHDRPASAMSISSGDVAISPMQEPSAQPCDGLELALSIFAGHTTSSENLPMANFSPVILNTDHSPDSGNS